MHEKTWPQVIKDMISQPIIWSALFVVIFADIGTEIYHRICFPLYGIPYVKRSQYIRIDRHKLKYLTFLEKLGCMYCGYTNGWLHFATAVAAETEKYWCHIRHQRKADDDFIEPTHHAEFQDFGDADAYKQSQEKYEKE